MFDHRRASSRATLWVAAFTASYAAFFAAPAWADDGDATPTASAAEPAAAIEFDTSLIEHEAEAGEKAEAALVAVVAATADDDDAAVEATEGDEAAAQAPSPTEQEPESETDPAATGASEPDTTPDSPDTATDSTASATVGAGAAPTAPSAPSTTPATGTTNVNVSVRIGSAGDNGSVSQTAIGVTPSSKPSSAAPTTTQAASPSAAGSAARASGNSTASPWYWEWNCRDLPLIPVVSPTDSAGESFPKSWTWIWNCGGYSEQYHVEPQDQYRPSNVNVSIRLSSPGDNGPVTQTTVAISAGGASVSLPTIEFPTVTLTTPAITVTAPAVGIKIPSIVVEAPTEVLTAQPAAGAPAEWPIDVALGNVSASAPSTSLTARPRRRIAPTPRGWIRLRRRRAAAQPRRTPLPAYSARSPPARARRTEAQHPARGTSQRKAKPAPRWTPTRMPPESKLPASPLSGTSASAAGAGGSPGRRASRSSSHCLSSQRCSTWPGASHSSVRRGRPGTGGASPTRPASAPSDPVSRGTPVPRHIIWKEQHLDETTLGRSS